ncbi:UPF0716 protein FxsA [Mesocricetibacter intestinalis]|uniref:UPF0716 protein FxsA n=1 Tax=Mesocricetibacter intestinalis TaxID=1521930 RepID=A0A4R6VCP4_9PAST|nr:FxsA family protein [Mesocricetibacter intestinalis]TDQ58063.1 UPF0716 protein FxsA [Mesocricetibacter intestinalis]
MPLFIFLLFAFLFIYIELSLILWLGDLIGAFGVILLLILSALIGIGMIRTRGWYSVIGVRRQIARGEIPTRSLLKSGLWIGAGILFLIPGFVTDLCAVFLLLPPVRLAIERFIGKGFNFIGAAFRRTTGASFYRARGDGEDIFEAEYEKEADEDKKLK